MLAQTIMLAESPTHPLPARGPGRRNPPTHLNLHRLKQLSMLLRVGLLHVALSHLLHHKVPVNNNILRQLAAHNAPLARDGQDANGRLGVDERVDAVGGVGEGELVCCLVGVRKGLCV